jgi:hypothetical protein
MKDQREVGYGYDVARSVLESGGYLLQGIDEDAHGVQLGFCIHVACLSSEPILDGRWNSTGGVGSAAIGFRARKVSEVCRELGIARFRMVYELGLQQEILRSYLQRSNEIAIQAFQGLPIPKEYADRMIEHLVAVMATLKRPECCAENEWRLQLDHENKFLRPRTTQGVCRFTVPICGAANIAEVLLPSESCLEETQSMLSALGMQNVPVRVLA